MERSEPILYKLVTSSPIAPIIMSPSIEALDFLPCPTLRIFRVYHAALKIISHVTRSISFLNKSCPLRSNVSHEGVTSTGTVLGVRRGANARRHDSDWTHLSFGPQ